MSASVNACLASSIATLLAEVSGSREEDAGFASLLRAPHALYADEGGQACRASPHAEDSYHVEETLELATSTSVLPEGPPNAAQHDSVSAEISILGFSEDLALFSVFDGHGGTEVAQHCSDRLHLHFTEHLTASVSAATSASSSLVSQESGASCHCFTCPKTIVTAALRSSFHATDQELAGTDAGEFVGATAVVAVIGSQHIWVAHCGDSRAVMQRGKVAVQVTSDHKPDRKDEAERIRAAGGRIVRNSGTNRVQGMLAMTRAIGDHYLRPYVIAEPEIQCLERTPADETMIIATDGLWDVFSSLEATSLASRCIARSKEKGMSKHGACRVAANVLAKVAMERGSRDNITVICIDISVEPSADDAGAVPKPEPEPGAKAAAAATPGLSIEQEQQEQQEQTQVQAPAQPQEQEQEQVQAQPEPQPQAQEQAQEQEQGDQVQQELAQAQQQEEVSWQMPGRPVGQRRSSSMGKCLLLKSLKQGRVSLEVLAMKSPGSARASREDDLDELSPTLALLVTGMSACSTSSARDLPDAAPWDAGSRQPGHAPNDACGEAGGATRPEQTPSSGTASGGVEVGGQACVAANGTDAELGSSEPLLGRAESCPPATRGEVGGPSGASADPLTSLTLHSSGAASAPGPALTPLPVPLSPYAVLETLSTTAGKSTEAKEQCPNEPSAVV